MKVDARETNDRTPLRTLRWDLELLRVIAILGVVAIHVIGLILAHPHLKGTATWNFAVAVQVTSIRCVPLFIMISGALILAPRMHAAGPLDFYRRRAGRLLPAVVFWHVFYVVVIRMMLLEQDLTIGELTVDLIDARVYTALYFLWLILGLYLVAPVVASFLAGGGHARAVGTATVGILWASALWAAPMIAGQLGAPRPMYAGMLSWWIYYVGIFVAGWAWRTPRPDSRRYLLTGPLAVAIIVFQVWQNLNAPDYSWLSALFPVGYISLLTSLSTVLLFITVIDLAARVRMPAKGASAVSSAGRATFGVFLFHLAVIAVIRSEAPTFYDDPAPAAKAAMFGIVVGVSFVVSMLAAKIPFVRRIF